MSSQVPPWSPDSLVTLCLNTYLCFVLLSERSLRYTLAKNTLNCYLIFNELSDQISQSKPNLKQQTR